MAEWWLGRPPPTSVGTSLHSVLCFFQLAIAVIILPSQPSSDKPTIESLQIKCMVKEESMFLIISGDTH